MSHVPGPAYHGGRLYECLRLVVTSGSDPATPGRPLDFSLAPPAPLFGDPATRVPPVLS